jgi:hypothetical protein
MHIDEFGNLVGQGEMCVHAANIVCGWCRDEQCPPDYIDGDGRQMVARLADDGTCVYWPARLARGEDV